MVCDDAAIFQGVHPNPCGIGKDIACADFRCQFFGIVHIVYRDFLRRKGLLIFRRLRNRLLPEGILLIENGNLSCAVQQCLCLNGGGNTARSQKGDFLSFDLYALVAQVFNVALAICDVACQNTVMVHNGVARADQTRRRGNFIQILEYLLLTGHRDICPLHLKGTEGLDGIRCLIFVYIKCKILIIQFPLIKAIIIHGRGF